MLYLCIFQQTVKKINNKRNKNEKNKLKLIEDFYTMVNQNMQQYETVINEIKVPTNEILKNDLCEVVNNYKNVVRVELAFIIANKKFFSYLIPNIEYLKNIKLFNSHSAEMGQSNFNFQSVGFIDNHKKIRIEYMEDKIKIYCLN